MADRLQIYDVEMDDFRPVTATDVAIFQATTNAYVRLRVAVDTVHAELMRQVADIRSRAGLAHEGGGV